MSLQMKGKQVKVKATGQIGYITYMDWQTIIMVDGKEQVFNWDEIELIERDNSEVDKLMNLIINFVNSIDMNATVNGRAGGTFSEKAFEELDKLINPYNYDIED